MRVDEIKIENKISEHCVDAQASHRDSSKPVNSYKCHNHGGNQVYLIIFYHLNMLKIKLNHFKLKQQRIFNCSYWHA